MSAEKYGRRRFSLLATTNTRLSAVVAALACVATYVLLWAVIA